MVSSIVLFGETHGFAKDSYFQKRIIKSIKAKLFLSEMLENISLDRKKKIKDFLAKNDDENFSLISKYGELKKTVSVASDLGMKIYGIDLKNMGRKNNSFLNVHKQTEKEKLFEKKLLRRREIYHSKEIKKHASKSKGVIFVSLGAYHLRKGAPIHQILRDYDVIIYMPNYRGKIILGPQKNMVSKEIKFEKRKKTAN
jgi:hypothetical protein